MAKLGERTSEWVWASDHMDARSWVFLVETGRNVDRDLEPLKSVRVIRLSSSLALRVSCVLGLQKCC